MNKKVLFFGIFDPQYARNRVLIQGFKENGFEVEECRTEKSGLHKYWDLLKKGHVCRSSDYEHIIVAFPGHSVMWVAYLVFGGRVVFDAFLSLYDANVYDRQVYDRLSIRGFRDWFLDWHACMLAGRILLDTNANIEYFADTFRIPRSKCIRVFVSTTMDTFYPREPQKEKESFVVHFHGTYIPLHGIEYIIDAAALLADTPIRFQIVGDGGFRYRRIKKRVEREKLSQVTLMPRVSLPDLAEYIAQADICLGIFGDTDKVQRVIPNKVYEYAATGKPIITADTPAIHELFTDEENIVLCEAASGDAIAREIISLRDSKRRQELGTNALQLMESTATPERLVAQLVNKLTS